MGHWNHRVVRIVDGHNSEHLGIHECYYDDDGTPRSVTARPMAPYGETLDELRAEMEMFAKALEKPVLDMTQFDKRPKRRKATPDEE